MICIVWVVLFLPVPCKPACDRGPKGSRGAARHGPGQELKRGVKRKALPIAATVAKKGYRNTVGRIREVLGV